MMRNDYYPDGDGTAFWQMLRHRPEVMPDIVEIKAEGERLLVSPPVEVTYSLFSLFETRGSRIEYEKVYFEKRRRLNTFALLAMLEPESEVYEQALLDAIWSICSEFTWCLPAHVNTARPISETIDLFSAETGFALSEIRLLLGDRLPELLQTRIVELAEERLFTPFIEKGPYDWERAEHNWAAVCAGSIGGAALLLLDGKKDSARLTEILKRTERSMSFYLKGFGDDGACLEGLGYWNYGFGYFIYYADILYQRTHGKLNWFQLDKVKRIAQFQQKCFLGGNAVANFSDALPQASVQLGLSCYLARKYEGEVAAPPIALRADYRDDHCSRWAPALRNLIWRDYSRNSSAWESGDFLLDRAAWLISRFSSEEGEFGFAAKGGHNAEPHNHNDLGQFMLAGDGVFFLSDLGCGEYTRDYFGEGRYEYDCNGSQGHSVPIIEGALQSPGQDKQAALLDKMINESQCRLSLELSGAYQSKKLGSFKRTWLWRKSKLPSLTLQDRFQFVDAPTALTERFVSLIKPSIAEPGSLLLKSDKLTLKLNYDHNRLCSEITPKMYRNHFGEQTIWYALDFHVLKPKESCIVEFTFKFDR